MENYVFGVSPPRIQDLIDETEASELSIIVFAYEYRPAGETCSRRRADVVYSRTGVARTGTSEARYNEAHRGFWPEDENNARSIRVIPSRFAAYLSVQANGNSDEFLPMRCTAEDEGNSFWVPLHKLFNGDECLKDLDLTVSLTAKHFNDKIRRIHVLTQPNNVDTDTSLDAPPFIFFDGIAELSNNPDMGDGLVVPVAHRRLVEPAIKENGEPLTYRVNPQNGGFAAVELGTSAAPAYIHARTKVENGIFTDLNDEMDVNAAVNAGNYDALNYVDFTGEGEVRVSVPQLVGVQNIDTAQRPAYSLVAAPDFFPSAGQRELTEWTNTNAVPADIRANIWGVRPNALCDTREPANLQFPNNSFDPSEDTITALVPLWENLIPNESPKITQNPARATYLPDSAAGVFAPGWAVSTDKFNGTSHLAAYGLGSPFPEDAKLCAALSTFWPAVAPDTARAVSPHTGNSNLLGTVAPMTDEEIGQIGDLPWDGIPGPKVVNINGEEFVECPSFLHVDYVDSALDRLFSIRLTSRVDSTEYQRRVLAMALAYKGMAGAANISKIRNESYVLSFQKITSGNVDLQKALEDTSQIVGAHVFRIDLTRVAGTQDQPSPSDHRKRLFPVVGRRLVLVDPDSGIVMGKVENHSRWRLILG